MNKEEVAKAFGQLTTRADVASLLGIKERSLRYFLFKRRPERLYATFTIEKRNGKSRKISAPCKEWKTIQRKLADVLACVYTPKVCAYGFIPGKNIVGNATQHTKRTLVLNIDLKDFFTQIHFGRIRGMLMNPPYSIGEEAATTIAQIACVNGVLPQGSPCSPILTNMVCAPLDNNMMRLAKANGFVYTRYADDITLSTYKKAFDPGIVSLDDDKICIGSRLLAVLEKQNFTINPEKVTLRKSSERQEVTGLTVNIFPNVRRSYIRNLRAILYHCQKEGIYQTAKAYIDKGFCSNTTILAMHEDPDKRYTIEEWFRLVLKGKIEHIRNVKGSDSLTYLSFAQKFNQITETETFDVSALTRLETIAEKNTFILEYTDDKDTHNGSAFYVPEVGLITCYHVVECGGNFSGFTYKNYPSKPHLVAGLKYNLIASNRDIDYAVFNNSVPVKDEYALKIGDSKRLRSGDLVTIIGYPNFQAGDTPYIQNCAITNMKFYMGAPMFTVSGRIVHGASGGVVLDSNGEVVGIIKGGIVSPEQDATKENQGFVPIHLVLEDMQKNVSKE